MNTIGAKVLYMLIITSTLRLFIKCALSLVRIKDNNKGNEDFEFLIA